MLGEQVYLNRGATCVDDAEIVLCEYRESYGSLCSRFDGLRGKLARKYDQPRNENDGNNQSVLSPPAAYTMPASAGGPDVLHSRVRSDPEPTGLRGRVLGNPGAANTGPGRARRSRSRRSQFLTSGEPATRPKMYDTIDPIDTGALAADHHRGRGHLRTPESLVSALYDAMGNGGIQILSDQPCLEAITHKRRYPLYPQGRLVVIVDEDLEADDRMNRWLHSGHRDQRQRGPGRRAVRPLGRGPHRRSLRAVDPHRVLGLRHGQPDREPHRAVPHRVGTLRRRHHQRSGRHPARGGT